MSPRLKLKTCRDEGQHFTPPSMKRPSPDPQRQLGTRGVQLYLPPATPGRVGVPTGVPPMLSPSAETGALRDRETGIQHQRDTEEDCHHYKAINHHQDSACHLSDDVNSRYEFNLDTIHLT
jgi:hypothetical protein